MQAQGQVRLGRGQLDGDAVCRRLFVWAEQGSAWVTAAARGMEAENIECSPMSEHRQTWEGDFSLETLKFMSWMLLEDLGLVLGLET